MKVGLIDVDMFYGTYANGKRLMHKEKVFPNLALMKLSAWHKSKGDEVGWYSGVETYDRVYKSKVFSETKEEPLIIQAKEVFYGGTGYCISLMNGKEVYQKPNDRYYLSGLPSQIEHIYPDYSLYPMIKDTAYGFLSRGCPRGCLFCHVAAKEGQKSYKVADLSEWWRGQKKIILCDPNLLACPERYDLLEQLAQSKARVDINQGMDARLINEEVMSYLCRVNLATIHFAWDNYSHKESVLRGLRCFSANYNKKFEKGNKAQVFVLTNYNSTPEQDLERVYTLRDMGFSPFIMVYDRKHAAPFYKSLQRWVNNRPIFNRVERFEFYDRYIAKE